MSVKQQNKKTKDSIKKNITKTNLTTFPLKLKQILKDQHSEIICWSQNGLKIIIKDKQKLANEILPQYFKSSRLHSFQRQLNMYRFRNTKDEFNQLVYSHPNFTQLDDSIQITKQFNYEENTLITEHFELQFKLQSIREQQSKLQNKLNLVMKVQSSLHKFYRFILSIILKESMINCSKSTENMDILGRLRRGLSSDSIFGIYLFKLANQVIHSFDLLDLHVSQEIATPVTEDSISHNHFYLKKQYQFNMPSV